MNFKARIALIIGIIAGYLGSLLLPHETNSLDTMSRQKYFALDKEIAALKQTNSRLEQELKMLKTRVSSSHSNGTESTGGSNVSELHTKSTSENNEANEVDLSDQTALLELAYQALESGDLDESTKQFNSALQKAKNEDERNSAIDGLLAVHKSRYDAIRQSGSYLHAAVWELFEMQKLKPSDEIKNEIITLSTEVLSRANAFQQEGDYLNSSDYVNILFHVSNMMGFEVVDESGQAVNTQQLKAQINEIQSQTSFLPSLKERASHKLYHGNDIEKTNVFWDYTKLAEVGGQEVWEENQFTQQFTEAALIHLNHLKSLNKTGEIQSRLDYIRYAFQPLMNDERIYNFH